MTREEIKNFNYRAMLKVALNSEVINDAIVNRINQLGYRLGDFIDIIISGEMELNSKFKRVLLKVHGEFKDFPKYQEAYEKYCKEVPVATVKQRHFIVVGDNNFWCTNVSISEDKNIEEELQKELEELRENLSPENVPDKFVVYETTTDREYLRK